jgi:hypothetical protein
MKSEWEKSGIIRNLITIPIKTHLRMVDFFRISFDGTIPEILLLRKSLRLNIFSGIVTAPFVQM